VLAAAERLTLDAVCEALLPTLEPEPGDSADLFRLSASRVGVGAAVEQAIATALSEGRAEELRLFIRLLSSRTFMLVAAGTPTPFVTLTGSGREAALQRMARHPLPQVRSGFQALRRLATFLFYSVVPESGENATWPAIRYSLPPPRPAGPGGASLALTRITQATTLDADVCIVGSGAGGGVVADRLATAGMRVVVLEAGSPDQAPDYDQREVVGMQRLYLAQGTTATRDVGVAILAGSAVGGGTAVNWQTCLRTPDHIRDEWSQRSGVTTFTADAFTQALDEVCRRISVGTGESQRNANNEVLARGCTALGFAWDETQRNARGCDQSQCGFCAFGCRHGGKRSTANTYLRDAQAAGDVTIVAACRAERVRFEGSRAVGVDAVVHEESGARHEVRVNARTVVVAAGALETPALLLRSGVRHPQLGRNLFLHPTTSVAGCYEERINGWLGAPQSVVSKHFSRLEGNFGYHLETAPVHPGLMALALPWTDARSHRSTMQRAANLSAFIVLARDRTGGRVTVDRQGRAVVDYVVRPPERALLQHGIAAAARVHWAAGALEVHTLHTTSQVLRRASPRERGDIDGFARAVQSLPVHGNRCGVFSAHQMGTCRMGMDPRQAVCDAFGAVHGHDGLHVADASLFPASSGVNPMLTVMALATVVGDGLANGARR
jgi:choline dehydrogenase-like flavoprotein